MLVSTNPLVSATWRARSLNAGVMAVAVSASACAASEGASKRSTAAAGVLHSQVDTGAYARALSPRPEVGGVGWLEAREGPGDVASQLALAELGVDITPAGHVAAFEVDHRFVNDGDALLEGTFRFTLPPGAVVTGLAMEIEGELMEGEFVEKAKARQTYERIVESMKDPALLEWEQGKTFKLRVFPIEPHADKRVVLRYLAPIHHDDRGQPLVVYPLAAPAMQGAIGRVKVHVDGSPVIERSNVAPREVLEVPLPAGWGDAPVLTQTRDGVAYQAVRVAPDWSAVPRPTVDRRRRDVVVVVDSSRSALEAWPLVRQSVKVLLEELDGDDRVAVVAGDLVVRDVGDGWDRPSSARIAAIDGALAAIEPDGASDLGGAMEAAGRLLREVDDDASGRRQVVYIGDGTPTWGEVDEVALRELASSTLGDAELHAIALGRGPQTELLQELCGRHRGAVVEPTSGGQVAAFGEFVAHASELRRIDDVRMETTPNADVVLPPGATWFEGQSQLVYLRHTSGTTVGELTLSGAIDGRPFTQTIELGGDTPGQHVDQLWAARRLASLASDPAAVPGMSDVPKEEVAAHMVAMSQHHGVLSRETSLLVLESEEAYERHQIARTQAARMAANAQDPAVSGRDLESLGGDPTSLSPGDLQPGDPEIQIPAPSDARSVVAVFPFGETKAARYDEALGVWTLRFLVADDTPAGNYDVHIRITHADGQVELTKATYTIDMVAPTVEVELQATNEPGVYRVLARQALGAEDARRERPEGVAAGDEVARALDAKRVRVLMPDGQTLILRSGLAGAFERDWKPRQAVHWPARVELTVTDRALNTRRQTVDVHAPTR